MFQTIRINKIARLLVVLGATLLCMPSPVQAQKADWNKLYREALTLEEQGNYRQAIVIARQALSIAEKTLGPDHPDVGTSLNTLANLYVSQGQYAQAAPLYKRSLAINEKAIGAEHPNMAVILSNLAYLFANQGQYAQAEPLYKRSLAINEKALGVEHPDVAMVLNNLSELYTEQGQYAKAEPLYKRSLAIREKVLGLDNRHVATSLSNLAQLYQYQGQYAQAEPLFKRSLAIREKALGVHHPAVATSLNNLGSLYQVQGQYAQAESLYKRSLAIIEKTLGPEHPDVAVRLNNLSGLYTSQGQYATAEPLYKRSLAIREKAFGPDHPDVANSLNNLAALYKTQGQYAQAEPLYKRSLAIIEKALGPEHPVVATLLSNLAHLFAEQGQYAQAEPLYKRSLAIREKALGAEHPDVAGSLNHLGVLYTEQGQYAKAEPLYKRSLAIREKAFGAEHRDLAESLNNLGLQYFYQGQYATAEPLYKRALAIIEKARGPDHPELATSLKNLALLYEDQGLLAQALSQSRRSSAIYRQRIVTGGTNDASVREASKNRGGFALHLSLLSRNPGNEAVSGLTDEALQVVQLAQSSGTASAIAKMAARFASGDDALAGLIKRKQDASDRRARREAQLLAEASKPPQERNAAAEQRFRKDIALVGKEIETIDAEMTRRFPEYQELTRPEPLAVSQVRALLKPDEAMLVYFLGESSFLSVVRPDRADFIPLKADVKNIAAKVATVRSEMELDEFGIAPRVSVNVLHELFQEVFAPALPYLAGVKRVMLVPSGPLQSLPFGILAASPPPTITGGADYRQVDWLTNHYAFSVLPSVSSIQAFRQFAKANSSREPFAGFGDPLIGRSNGATRGKRAKLDTAVVFRNVTSIRGAQGSMPATEIADVEAIRSVPRLPETADELRAIGKSLKANPDRIWLQENATESRIKGLDLSNYQTLAFATHGMMAGEIDGAGEPGLILTPPRQGTTEDDGYLSTSEIARLKLNADWVILSACNTAAADGTPGAEGLSGLAKAFFYAGARSLLVSNWYVESEAAVKISTGTLKRYADNPAIGKAEALRQAMQELLDDPEFSHPFFWAPFSVVGEGGASFLQ